MYLNLCAVPNAILNSSADISETAAAAIATTSVSLFSSTLKNSFQFWGILLEGPRAFEHDRLSKELDILSLQLDILTLKVDILS